MLPGRPSTRRWFLTLPGSVAATALPLRLLVADDEPAPPPVDRHPELRRLAATEEVWIDLPAKRVVVGGVVVLDAGPLEFFACPRHTKEHESVVAVNASARLVHAALLAIGLEPGKPVSFDPVYSAATGPALRLTMRWTDAAGVAHEADARSWVRETRTGKALAADWVFAGSGLWTDAEGREHYHGDAGDFISVSNFPTATLDLPIESSQSNEALLFDVFPDRVPPPGTVIDIVITRAPLDGPAAAPSPRR